MTPRSGIKQCVLQTMLNKDDAHGRHRLWTDVFGRIGFFEDIQRIVPLNVNYKTVFKSPLMLNLLKTLAPYSK
jgi:hypothetical protein